jgi:restriction system protein
MSLSEALLEAFARAFIMLWPLWVFVGAVFLIRLALAAYRWRRLARSGIREIDRMDGKTFEHYLEVLFTRLGFKVERTRYVGDYGADLVVSRDGVKTAVQAKRFRRKVGVAAVQQAVAAKAQYGCSEAMVVTNAFYTAQAVRLARANKVKLWDRNQLVSALLSTRKATRHSDTDRDRVRTVAPQERVQPSLFPVAKASCATCGEQVSDKVREYCLARPKRFGGLVYCYEHQKPFR